MRSRARATPAAGDDVAVDRAAPPIAGPGNQVMAKLAAGAVSAGAVQTKLVVGPAGDRYEREADAVADAVTAPPSAVTQRQDIEDEELQMSRIQRQDIEDEELQMSRIQRQDIEDEELQMSRIQRRVAVEEPAPIGAAGGALDASIESSVTAPRGSGRSLDSSVRREMESSFNADFSGVKVHTGPESDRLNASMGAQAFTHGRDVFIRSGDYTPGSPAGKHLLAHELTHVVQQGAAPARKENEER